ncbi:MAG: hypothetical protein HY289_15610 [Planctomycetes bacterium]|nr:hypothetical protein [Planctomycetota bacterium]
MKRTSGLSLIACFLFAGPAAAQTDDAAKARQDAFRRMQATISTADYQEHLPFAKFLESLSKQLSQEKKFTVRLDRDAFGKDADKILNEKVVLPPVPARMVANTALRLTLSQTLSYKFQIEFTAGPDELVITTRDRSLFTATYEIGDLLKHARELHESLPKDGKIPGAFFLNGPDRPDYDLKADPARPDEWIVRQLIALTDDGRADWDSRKLPSTIRVVNQTRLIVHTTPSVHEEITLALDTFRRLLDIAVVMNAKLYALDAAEYQTTFASAFVDPKDKSQRRLASIVSEAQWKYLQGRKPILEGNSDKLRPEKRAEFLSHKTAYRFQAKPGDANVVTAFEVMSFAVRPTVSPDRRCLRLELFHDVNQLVKLTKGTMIDLKTSKDVPIELPNVRKSSATQTIEIHDGQPIMLAVDYRPKDKVWLVVAEPRIYIEAEEDRLRIEAIKPMPLADEKPAPPEPPEEAFVPRKVAELPSNDDVKQILDAVVRSVLTDPEHKKTHAHYGTPGEAKFTLTAGNDITWPKGFRPTVPGFEYQELDPKECRGFKKKLLGIWIDEFTWTANRAAARVVVVVDDAIHGVLGALRINYQAKRVGKGWKVEWTEAFTR